MKYSNQIELQANISCGFFVSNKVEVEQQNKKHMFWYIDKCIFLFAAIKVR